MTGNKENFQIVQTRNFIFGLIEHQTKLPSYSLFGNISCINYSAGAGSAEVKESQHLYSTRTFVCFIDGIMVS